MTDTATVSPDMVFDALFAYQPDGSRAAAVNRSRSMAAFNAAGARLREPLHISQGPATNRLLKDAA